ncbi:MAG: helix-turn-helix domain-containing protein [Chloroflexota bacterium]|nr:helix-turn-helix domain-containing protein [Chloroflexota bacterium]
MITSHDILTALGLKSAKTLWRWQKSGLIPEPLVRPHPSGRGRIAYWPDWVLDRCIRIAELRRQGHSLESARKVLELHRLGQNFKAAESELRVSDLLASQEIKLTPERDGTLLDAFLLTMLASVEHLVVDSDGRRRLIDRLRDQDGVDLTLNLLRAGYNPVLMYSGKTLEIVPDFLVSHRLSEVRSPHEAFVVAPLLPTLSKSFPWLKSFVGTTPNAWPAPKVWVQDGDTVVEYVYYPNGIIGFELIRETAKVVSVVPNQVGSNGDPSD